jgi:hypothetical protein
MRLKKDFLSTLPVREGENFGSPPLRENQNIRRLPNRPAAAPI